MSFTFPVLAPKQLVLLFTASGVCIVLYSLSVAFIHIFSGKNGFLPLTSG